MSTKVNLRAIKSIIGLKVCVLTLSLVLFIVSSSNAQKSSANKSQVYVATLTAINPQLTNSQASGQAIFIVKNGMLKITMVVKGVSPGMHLQHIHGFITSKESTCPPAEADTNGDGIIDLLETEPYAGTTLIPFNSNPSGLMIKSDTYSVASDDGILIYEMTVPLSQLNAAIKKEYKIDKLDLGNRLIFIHGVPKDMVLPKTVGSLPGVPAYITVPIACGEIRAL